MTRFTADQVRASVEPRADELIKPWAAGRPETWVPDPATKHLIALGYWLREELVKLGANEPDRKTQEWKFNRLSRTYDVWETAAECLNDVIDGTVEQNRRGIRRWG